MKLGYDSWTGLSLLKYEGFIDGLVQERRNSIANALGLHLSCTKPSIFSISYNSFKPGGAFMC